MTQVKQEKKAVEIWHDGPAEYPECFRVVSAAQRSADGCDECSFVIWFQRERGFYIIVPRKYIRTGEWEYLRDAVGNVAFKILSGEC